MGLLGGLVNSLRNSLQGELDKKKGTSEEDSYYVEAPKTELLGYLPVKGLKDKNDFLRNGESATWYTSSRESIFLTNTFDIPNWGVKDFINERASWQKGLDSPLGEPTWFYFKIFFKFDTSYGLLGHVLTNGTKSIRRENTAVDYLDRIKYRYKQENIFARLNALKSFVKTLSFISSVAPWTFISIKDLGKALEYDLTKPNNTKTLQIECMRESVDMRLNTLFDMYRYAAFDFAHDKEILPENLRKFDMDVVVFQVPIKYWQTSMKDINNQKTNYKNLFDQSDTFNRMSFKLFTFQNCEFDVNSFSSLLGTDLNNEKPFEMKPSFKINYDKVYVHTLNEWTHTIIGDSVYKNWAEELNTAEEMAAEKAMNEKKNEILQEAADELGMSTDAIMESNVEGIADSLNSYDRSKFKKHATTSEETRIDMMSNAFDNKLYYNMAASNYQYVVEASEDVISNAMRIISPSTALGNLYKDPSIGDMLNFQGIKDSAKSMWNNLTGMVGYGNLWGGSSNKSSGSLIEQPTNVSSTIRNSASPGAGVQLPNKQEWAEALQHANEIRPNYPHKDLGNIYED